MAAKHKRLIRNKLLRAVVSFGVSPHYSYPGGGYPLTNQLWYWNLISNEWESVADTKGSWPCPRLGHSAVVIGSFLYMFGGVNTTGTYMNDGWKLDLKKRSWSLLSFTGNSMLTNQRIKMGKISDDNVRH